MNLHRFLRRPLAYAFSRSKQDFYKVLGVSKTANKAEIKKAYARLAQEHHPDKNPDPASQEKFAKITEAYQTLNDAKKREIYDNYGMSADEQKEYYNENGDFGGGFSNSGFGGFWDQQGGFSNFENMFRDFDDFFNFSETNAKKSRPVKGTDVYVNLTISFMDAVNGSVREVSYKMKDTCKTCGGSGCKPGTNPVKCGTCKGKGTINYRQGPMNIQMTCGDCHGQGTIIKHFCGTCKGSGKDIFVMKQSVNIPRGINTGQNLRLSGKGQKGENGAGNGDLIVRVTVKEDKIFRRDGYDVHIDKELSVTQAVLGTEIEITNLEGKRMVKIPPGISNGSRIKLANQGIRKLAPNQNQRGDFYINIVVKIPKTLTKRQREIFEELRDLEEKGNAGAQTNANNMNFNEDKLGKNEEKQVEKKSMDDEEILEEGVSGEEDTSSGSRRKRKGFMNRFKKWS